MAGEVPREFYLSNSCPRPREGMATMVIIAGAGGKKKLKFKVDVAHSILRWEFLTEGGDIAFRVYFKGQSKFSASIVTVELIPLDRVQSDLITEEGQITCDQPGKCLVDHYYCYFIFVA